MTTPTWVPAGASTSGATPVTLTIPADPAMVRVGRLTASSVASLAELDIDDIDDVKIAVSEVLTLLIEQGTGAPVTLSFSTDIGADGGTFSIEGTTAATSLDLGQEEIALTAAVLGAVSDEHRFGVVDGRIVVAVTKTVRPPERGEPDRPGS